VESGDGGSRGKQRPRVGIKSTPFDVASNQRSTGLAHCVLWKCEEILWLGRQRGRGLTCESQLAVDTRESARTGAANETVKGRCTPVESTLFAGESLADHTGVLVNLHSKKDRKEPEETEKSGER